MSELIDASPSGLWCERGSFHIDPSSPVPCAVITHAHGDHATPGHGEVHFLARGEGVLRQRIDLGETCTRFVPHAPGEVFELGSVRVSLHPAGHVLGSAQVRVEAPSGEVWVMSGDYKRAADPTCAAFEPVPCDVFVTESTFALPIYRFPAPDVVLGELIAWWRANAEAGRASLLYCYALGKAQRILAELSDRLPEATTVYAHGAHISLTERYAEAGVSMLPLAPVDPKAKTKKTEWAGRLVLAPPSVRRSPWVRRFGDHQTAFASGWMMVRGTRRGRGLNRGFALSDHADWAAILKTVEQTGARRVFCTHGHGRTLARFLREERGIDARPMETEFRGEAGSE
ncbi:MAG: ligase-associated DNA damage response exonuclease [Myxococcota bacterium]